MSWGNPETISEKLAALALSPIAAIYGTGVSLRSLAYDNGWLKSHKCDAQVISVGNITCGGTGKTPIVIDLAQRLIDQGHKVGIVSRGYRRRSTESVFVVSNGQGKLAKVNDAGDEALMIAQAVPETVVIVGAKRAVTAEVAIKVYQCDYIILDDGFQHRGINRDQDIVLIDYNDNPKADALMPAGRLRESLSALKRATSIVITKVPDSPDQERLESLAILIRKCNRKAQITACHFAPDHLRSLGSAADLNLSALKGTKVVAFSGLARPDTFVNQLRELGTEVVENITFADHHWFNSADIERIRSAFTNANADFIVTTAKDAVKLESSSIDLPIKILELKTEWIGPLPLTIESERASSLSTGK